MKRLILICSLAVLMAVPASTVKAVPTEVNPAEWEFHLETYGGTASWTSPTYISTGYPQYNYSWTLNYAYLYITDIGWYDVLDYIPSGDKSGSGTATGLPFVVLDKDVGEIGIFTASVYAGVDSSGYGFATMTDVALGYVEFEGENYGVEGFQCGGNAWVMAVPEPATVCLLGLGALSLLRRKRR